MLNLIHFFTVGTDEVRCWTVRRDSKAPEAAGMIHTDFEKGFVSAECVKYKTFIEIEEEDVMLRLKKKLTKEGKEYVV